MRMALIRGMKNANKHAPVFQPYPNGVLMEGKAEGPFPSPAITPFLSVDAGIKRQHFRRFCGQRKPAIGQDAVRTLYEILNFFLG